MNYFLRKFILCTKYVMISVIYMYLRLFLLLGASFFPHYLVWIYLCENVFLYVINP